MMFDSIYFDVTNILFDDHKLQGTQQMRNAKLLNIFKQKLLYNLLLIFSRSDERLW